MLKADLAKGPEKAKNWPANQSPNRQSFFNSPKNILFVGLVAGLLAYLSVSSALAEETTRPVATEDQDLKPAKSKKPVETGRDAAKQQPASQKPGKKATAQSKYPKPKIGEICDLIAETSQQYNLPEDFFARLIWKESRFDHLALSPVGARGIAQFMPATAKIVGLKDPYDFRQAIPASASHLNDLRNKYGNLGLAAAAYNAGGGRVSKWLYKGGYLPFETEDYVLFITGEPADNFADKGHKIKARPLDEKLSFGEACRQLPIVMTRTTAMAQINPFPWGIQIAGNFRRAVVRRSVARLKSRYSILKTHKVYIQRRRTPMARRSIYAARLGARSRGEANNICASLKRAGGACVVTRN